MNVQEKTIEIIVDFETCLDGITKNLDTHKGLSLERKLEIMQSIEIALSALSDAKQSIENNKDDPYYLLPFVVSLITFGQVSGELSLTTYNSQLKSEYRKKFLQNDPKQKALKEIESQYQKVKNQFKRRGFSAQFVREMHFKYPIITEQKTIANLVARLNKVNETIPR